MAQSSEVNVVFGASVGGLLAGVGQVKEAIESLRAPVDDFVGNLRGISEALGLAFAVDKLREFSVEMAEIGENAVNMGLALGTSAEQFQQLNEAMALVGASGDALARVYRMMSRAAETAIGSDLSRQADAFRALNIDAKQFTETLRTQGVIPALKELAEAAKATGQTSEAGPLGWIFGRGADPALFRFVSEGAAGIDKYIASVKAAGAPNQEMLHTLDEFSEKIHLLEQAFKNLGISIIAALAGPLGWFTDSLSKNYENLEAWIRLLAQGTGVEPGKGAAGRGIFGNLPDIVGDASNWEKLVLQDIRRRESEGSGGYQAINRETGASGAYQMLDETWRRWARAVGVDTNKYPTARDAPEAMQDAAALHGYRTEGLTPWKASAAHSRLPHEGGEGGEHLPDVHVEAEAAHNNFMQNTTEEKKALDEQLKKLDEAHKSRMAWLELERKTAGDNEQAVTAITQQETALTKEYLAQRAAAIAATPSDVVRKGYLESTVALTHALATQLEAERRFDDQRRAAAISEVQTRIKTLDEQEKSDLKAVETRRELWELSAEQAAQAELKIVQAHKTAVEAQLADERRLAGDKIRLQQDVANREIELAQKTADKEREINDKLARERHQAAMGTAQEITGGLASGLTGIITGRQTVGQAAAGFGEQMLGNVMNRVMSALFDKLIEQTIINVLTQIAADSVNTGFLGMLLSAILVKPSFLGTTFGGGGIAHAQAGWHVPTNSFAMLHANEMVLPPHISQGFQDMFAGGGRPGGGGVAININAVDPQHGAQYLMRNADTISAAMRQSGLNGGWSPRSLAAGGR